MKTFFTGIETMEDLKKEYKILALLHHPDRGGDEEVMKKINSAYAEAIKDLNKNKRHTDNDNNLDDNFKEVIDKLIRYKDIEIEVCGCWIWISGNTKPIKELIKTLGFRWAAKKKMWYLKPEWYKGFSKNEWSIDQIRNKYGSSKVKKEEKKILSIK
jgi:hypothetical protein